MIARFPAFAGSSCIFAAILAVCIWGIRPAQADPETPILYDARSVGMGGTGAAYIDSGAAVFLNPASLDRIDTLALTLAATPAFVQLSSPFAGPGSEVESTTGVAPFFLVGGGVRLHERVVIGLGAYLTGGVGSRYEDVPSANGEDLDLSVGLGEVSLPVSVRILDNLSLGVGVRLVYVRQESDTLIPGFNLRLQQDLDGFGFPGFHVGVRYQPIEALNLAFTYRSKVTADMSGTSELPVLGEADTETEWSVPHAFRLGTAVQIPGTGLLLALDAKLQLYNESHDEVVTVARFESQTIEQTLELDWKNTVTVQFGAEYTFSPLFAARLGYATGSSATPEETAGPFFPAPGQLHAVTAGVGFQLPHVELGVAGAYSFQRSTLEERTPNGTPGEYSSHGFFASLSATYRL